MSNKKHQVFIDFDDVLINTRALKKEYFKLFGKFGIPQKEAQKSYKETAIKYKGYRANRHLRLLRKSYPKLTLPKTKQLLNSFFRKTKKYIFKDVVGFLVWLRKAGWKVIMVSSGDPKFQRNKITASGLSKYFQRVYITKDYRKSAYLKKTGLVSEDSFVFLDDRIEVIEDVKKHFPGAVVIQIIRHPNHPKAKTADFVKKDLSQVKALCQTRMIHEKTT